MIDLKKFLKMRLTPKWKNKEYVNFVYDLKKQGEETHHLTLKANSDLFLVNIAAKRHSRIHTFGYEDGEFETLFLESLGNIMRFIEEKTK